MKFKSKQDLVDLEYGIQKHNPSTFEQWEIIESDGFIKGVDRSFESFVERIGFYRDYCDNALVQLARDHPEAIENLNKHIEEHFGLENMVLTNNEWNEWLFNYCFGDLT